MSGLLALLGRSVSVHGDLLSESLKLQGLETINPSFEALLHGCCMVCRYACLTGIGWTCERFQGLGCLGSGRRSFEVRLSEPWSRLSHVGFQSWPNAVESFNQHIGETEADRKIAKGLTFAGALAFEVGLMVVAVL